MMATYFHGGAEMKAATGDNNNLQTLYLMNPNFISPSAYPEGHHIQSPPSMLLLNSTIPTNTLNQGNISQPSPHHQLQQQQEEQLIGIPLTGPHQNDPSGSSVDYPHHRLNPAMHGLAVSRVHYNLWSPTNEASPSQPGTINELGQMGFRRPVSATQHGELSLSLSPGQHHHQIHQPDDMRMLVTVAAGPPMAGNGEIMDSKYLRAAQELLEELANVSDVDDHNNLTGQSSGVHKDKAKSASEDGDMIAGDSGGDESSKKSVEFTTAQRLELQMKKAKLLKMLDEVEQRYRQYHAQMQVVASSLEQAAGHGSAKMYTSLALNTISKQLRSLKDTISGQIKETSKRLGDGDHGSGGKVEGRSGSGSGSRLRLIDHEIRQQRALQQFGMMQHNAWRPQRGLPERAVSVLRAWLFEHFLHPYPKDSDKHLLAKQTGLTRSQVSNWFINARVRLWKPMVEEMYVEETKSQERNGGSSKDKDTNNTTNNNNGFRCSSPRNELMNKDSKSSFGQQHVQQQDGVVNNNEIQTRQHDNNNQHTTNDMISSLSAISTTSSQGVTLVGSTSDMESLMARSPKKQRSNSDMNLPSSILSMDVEMKPLDKQQQQQQQQHAYHQLNREHLETHHHHHHPSSLMSSNGDRFEPYIINEMNRFNPDQLSQQHPYHVNGVSLTLGLPHCKNQPSLSGNHGYDFIPNQSMQLGRRVHEIGPGEADFCGISMAQPSHPNYGYETLDLQSRKRFATHQILHDFVA